jgi:ATP-dependent Clp protease ATP-binding subunit ClpA
MFERFAEPARKVVVLAQEEAGLLHHTCIGTEHILLGLVRENEGVGARVLSDLDVSPDDDLDSTYALRDPEDAWRVGEHVLENVPAVRELTVSVTDQRMLEARTVSRTFRR